MTDENNVSVDSQRAAVYNVNVQSSKQWMYVAQRKAQSPSVHEVSYDGWLTERQSDKITEVMIKFTRSDDSCDFSVLYCSISVGTEDSSIHCICGNTSDTHHL